MPHGHVVTRWKKFSKDNTRGAMAAEQELRSQIERDQLPRPPWVLTLLEKFTTFHSWETREESEGVGRGNGGRGMQCGSHGKIQTLTMSLKNINVDQISSNYGGSSPPRTNKSIALSRVSTAKSALRTY